MSQCPKCGLQMGLHHSVLPGCTCGTSAPFTYPIQPQKRQWVGLTDDEAMQTWDGIIKYAPGEVRVKDFARAIEAKLKEKNT